MLTLLCYILDVIAFFVAVAAFDTEITAVADISLLFLACANIAIDAYYVVWVISAKVKFPDYVANQIVLALLGVFKKLNLVIAAKLEKLSDDKQSQISAAASAPAEPRS